MSQATISDLSDNAIDVAAAYAVAYPRRPARTIVTSWINKARRKSNKVGLKPDQVPAAIVELVARGLLTPSVEGSRGVAAQGPGAVPGTITRFCELAVERRLADAVIEGLQEKYRSDYFRGVSVPGQRIRIALIRGHQQNFDDHQPDEEDFFWLLENSAEPYLKKLPPQLRQYACAVCLSFAVETFHRIDAFVERCQRCAPAFDELVPTVALGRVLSGQFEQARECFASLPAAVKNSKSMVVACLATEALIATLCADDSLAYDKITACIEAEKSGTRKRKVYPGHIAFSLALLSLFRSHTPERGALLRSLRSMVKTSRLAANFESLMMLAEDAKLPRAVHRPRPMVAYDLDSVLWAIASCWHADYQRAAQMRGYHILLKIFERVESTGYQWVAAETLSVLEAAGQTESIDAGSLELSPSHRHERLGTRTLTKLVTTLEEWEMSLQTLEGLIPKPKAEKKAAVAPTVKQSRLIWQVTPYGDRGEVFVAPLEQRLGKSGKWSAGRAVSLKRLHGKADEMNFLTDQDKKAAAAIESWHVGWGTSAREYEVGARAVYQLVGHPYVVSDNGQMIEVVESAARLEIGTHDDHLKLAMIPEPIASLNYRMAFDINTGRIEVTHYSAAQLRISQALNNEAIQVPMAAKQRLLDIASALAVDIPVQSDSKDSNSEQRKADPTPLLQLDYKGGVLNILLQVEPVSGSEQFFNCGEGGEIVYINAASGTIQAVRDLPQERSLMQALVATSVQLTKGYDGRPSIQVTDTESVLELLDELQQLDIRCLWPRDMPLKVTARADSKQLNLKIKSASEWFSASGELQYSEQDSLSLSNLLKLIKKSPQSRFLELAKGEFLALSETLQSQLQSFETFGSAQSARDGEQRLHGLSMLALEPLLDSATVSADKHWRNWRERIQKAGVLEADLPPTLQAELRPYQLEGYQWLTRIAALGAGACLADDMGLGKTLQTLALLLQRAPGGAALVVAPTSVTGNWLQEAQRFAPTLNAALYTGTAEERQRVLKQLQPFDLLIVSYGLLHNDIKSLSAVQWHTAVLDEAQAIKNAATQRAKAARKLNADFRLATTGTPIQNNLMDLHSLFAFLIPGFLGSMAKYRQTFALPIERDNDDSARQQLRTLVAPFMLRRHKRDVLKDLPARTDITLSVELSGEEAALYEALRQQALDAVMKSAEDKSDGSKKLRVLAELMKLRRLCCNPQLIQSEWAGPMAKLSLFANTIDELLANKHKVLVFSQFVDHLKLLEAHLQKNDISYQYLDGSTTAKQRTERVAAFQSGSGDVFLISLTAGGTGLNLTAADYVIHMDPWWNPAVEDQASDRAHRIGQQRPVTIYRMVTAGTIEAQIQELHATKRELADSLLADTDSATLDLESLLKMLQTPAIV